MNRKPEYGIQDIDLLMSDREKFEEFVYTPIDKALDEIEERRRDPSIEARVFSLLDGRIPQSICSGDPRAVIFRQVATPNFEIRRFMHLVSALDNLKPIFGEHRDDKFVSVNEYKHSLGKIIFYTGHGNKFDFSTVIDLVGSDGKMLSEIRTIWGQPLIEFHHELFKTSHYELPMEYFLNISPYLRLYGSCANDYYYSVMLWFITHSLLFENFMLGDKKEKAFTRDIFLPSFIKAYETAGNKPLVINLLPTVLENEKFWLSHPISTKDVIVDKLSNLR